MEHRGLAPLVLTTLVLLAAGAVSALAAGAASDERRHEDVPVFVIGSDGGLSPYVLRREEFREFVFPRLAEAMARGGLGAIGEEPFRARYDVDGVPGDFSSRWMGDDFVHFANSVAVDEAGNTAPYIVLVDIWGRYCGDDQSHACIDFGAEIFATASGAHVDFHGPREDVRIPVPVDCEEYCILSLLRARSEELFHPLGAAIASRISEHMSARDAPARQ